ncbi:MAG: rod shape-determining protein RodA [Clostridia bacterium]|jgi:Bacterial cell division membrane protein|nr:rod shape-determining protein RodA [Clostridia bacterium]MBR5380084.1 rod shape-determining protein RodA [Clostridia bacterium]
MQRFIKWLFRLFRKDSFQRLRQDWTANKYRQGLFMSFDWPLYALVMAISVFGVIAIFSATSAATDEEVTGLVNLLNTHPITYARLQFIWIILGNLVLFLVASLDYHFYGKYARVIYFANIIVLLSVLTVQAGRGGMRAFFSVGGSNTTLGQRTFQPSEFGKVAMIISLAHGFSQRKSPIRNLRELWPTMLFVGLPMVLVFLQPDFGTALVYMVMYVVVLYISGTKRKLIYGLIAVMIAVAIPLWFYLNTASDSFRLTRILMWLNPSQYPDDARQVINGQIAIGSGGLTGKGVTSVGSFASLGYIPDDHTDFCFAIVCEAFGFIGGVALIIAFMLFLARLIQHALHTDDKFGEYVIVCTTAMFMFHILENICMILGILPVTGIPLPFISYGGSNYLTNMAALGLVMNVVMRSRQKQLGGTQHVTKKL